MLARSRKRLRTYKTGRNARNYVRKVMSALNGLGNPKRPNGIKVEEIAISRTIIRLLTMITKYRAEKTAQVNLHKFVWRKKNENKMYSTTYIFRESRTFWEKVMTSSYFTEKLSNNSGLKNGFLRQRL